MHLVDQPFRRLALKRKLRRYHMLHNASLGINLRGHHHSLTDAMTPGRTQVSCIVHLGGGGGVDFESGVMAVIHMQICSNLHALYSLRMNFILTALDAT